jgi:tryptophan synthase alpha chain
MNRLDDVFQATAHHGRSALIGYCPAGFPSTAASIEILLAMLDGGCDAVEVGLPFSDPVLDGPVIQSAAHQALVAGFRVREVFDVLRAVTTAGPAVVMTYFNPVLAHGVDAFADDVAAAGGSGVITPDLIVDEADAWLAATDKYALAPIFLVAPSSPRERIARTAAATRGFLYAASTMGVTGVRDRVSSAAPDLVARCRQVTELPIGVGLGVRTGGQAAEVAGFADAVIVGSAFVSAAERGGVTAVRELAGELADGVRRGRQ